MAAEKKYILAGVMGWPVHHSRSPVLHNYWIAHYGLHGAYVLLPVAPDNLESALRALPKLGFAGCNLTIPHKVSAMQVVDAVDPLAQRIGAINTVVVQADGSLLGLNTDGFGYIQSVLDAQPQWKAQAGPAYVLGAGGAARAIIVALIDQGVPKIRLSNRSPEKVLEMAQEFGSVIQPIPWTDRHAGLAGVSLLVNTTNQGMSGQPALDISLEELPRTALVSDVIYVPTDTPLLCAAKARGNPIVPGLGMLLNQARPAFEAWFGISPQITPELLQRVHATL